MALVTRLRYVASSDPDALTAFLSKLGHRVMIYQIQSVGKQWWLWYVPPDDMKSPPDSVVLD